MQIKFSEDVILDSRRAILMPRQETLVLSDLFLGLGAGRRKRPDAMPNGQQHEIWERLLGLLDDPFAQREAAEAASVIATRAGAPGTVLPALREPGLGSTWRWVPRARLGDDAWAAALVKDWDKLSQPVRIQALDAAALLPAAPRSALKAHLRSTVERAGGQLQKRWEAL